MSDTTVTVSETDVTQITIATVAPSATSIRNVAISATAPSGAGQALITTSTTAAAWADIATQAELDVWPGTANVATLGTITTGTWNATTIAATKGGTGLTAYALGDLLYASAQNVLAALTGNTTTTRKFLRQTGDGAASAAPAWDTVTKADVGLGSVENTALSTWAGTANITTVGAAAVTAHQAALTIAETQITDGSILARVAGTETITGLYTFSHASGLLTDIIGERTAAAGVTVDGVLLKDGGITGALTGNASTATALQTARAINGVNFDGTAAITVTAAAGTLSGTTLNATVTASSLTSLGTIASLVATTADINGGTIDGVTIGGAAAGAGTFTTLEATTSMTLPTLIVSGTGPSVRWYDTDGTANVRRYRATVDANRWNLSRVNDAESALTTVFEFNSSSVGFVPHFLSVGSNYAGAQAAASATPRLTVGGTTTSDSGSATQLSVAGSLTAAATSAVLYGARISATYASGGFATTVAYGLKIEDVSGAATNVALQTGVGDVVFGGWLSLAAATTAAASANIPHGTAPTAPVNGDLWTTTAGLFGRIDGATKQFATATFAADIASTTTGVMFSSQVVLRYVAPRAITLADDFAGSRLKAGTSATAETVLVVKVNGSSVGTITVAAAGTTGTFTTTGGAVSLAAGDVLTVECPSLADATLADVSITFAGTATSTSGSYDVAGYWEGVLTDDAVVVRVVSVREFVVTDSSRLAAGTAATAKTVLDVQVDGVSVGSVTVAIAGDTGTFALSGGAASVEAGSVLTLVGPATADVTLADLSVTFKGTEVAA